MANNWPDGGEQLSQGERLAVGAVAVLVLGGFVAGLLLFALRFLAPVSWLTGAIAGAIGLSFGLLWVRPWETEGPRSARTRRPFDSDHQRRR